MKSEVVKNAKSGKLTEDPEAPSCPLVLSAAATVKVADALRIWRTALMANIDIFIGFCVASGCSVVAVGYKL